MYNWKIISEEYLDFLRKIEGRIPLSNYGDSKYKPFFGVLFEIAELSYVTQISSPKEKHINMPENLDFHKIYNPKYGNLMTIVNLNYMFPVAKNQLIDLDYKNMDSLRKFGNETERSKYIYFLKLQLKEIDKVDLTTPAVQIYKNRYDDKWKSINNRCFDFKHLEERALEYCKIHNAEISTTTSDIERKPLDELLQEAKCSIQKDRVETKENKLKNQNLDLNK